MQIALIRLIPIINFLKLSMELCANKATLIFKSFIRELTRTPSKLYYNKKDTIQSSVGMIFKLQSDGALTSADEIIKSEF